MLPEFSIPKPLAGTPDLTDPNTWPEVFTRKQLSDLLGVKEQTLAAWACRGQYGLKFVKVGRSVRYFKGDVQEFVVNRTAIKSFKD